MKTITIDVIKGTADVNAVEGDVGIKVTITNTPQEWDNCTVFALLTQGSKCQHIKVVDDTFKIPPAFTDANKAFKFGVYAVGANASRDVRESIWIRVADSDFTTEDIEITSQTLDDILMLQAQYTQYKNAEEDRAEAETKREEAEAKRVEAESQRQTDISTIKDNVSALQKEMPQKVDKVDGMWLSQNSYTDHDAEKLAGIEYGAQVNEPVDQTYKSESTNAQSGKAVAGAIANLVNGSPEALDTLFELANALGNDENFATTVMDEIGKKVDKINGYGLVNVDYKFSVNDPADSIVLKISRYDGGSPEEIEFLSKETSKHLFSYKADVENFKDQLKSGEFPVETAINAEYAYFDYYGRAITETYAEKTKVSNQIPDDDILVPNTEYILGIKTDFVIYLPSIANAGDVVYLSFISGENPTTLRIETTYAYDFELIPEPKRAYEIYGKYDGRKWMLGYSEYDVADGDL